MVQADDPDIYYGRRARKKPVKKYGIQYRVRAEHIQWYKIGSAFTTSPKAWEEWRDMPYKWYHTPQERDKAMEILRDNHTRGEKLYEYRGVDK